MLLSYCVVCGSKKSKFVKEQEARGLLSMIGKIPLLGPTLMYLLVNLVFIQIFTMGYLKS